MSLVWQPLKRTGVPRWLTGFCALLGALPLCAASLDLSGEWQLQLDRKDEGIAGRWWEKPLDDSIQLPGTTSIAGKGEPLNWDAELKLDRKTIAHLRQKFSYVGPAWYRRIVKVPADWSDRDVELTLERVLWETRVWVNGREIGMQDSLSTPHRHDVTEAIRPGWNEIVIRVDNRKKIEIGGGHAYTPETQTIWNGIVGDLKLEAFDRVRIAQLRLRPDLKLGGAHVRVTTWNSARREVQMKLGLEVRGENFRGGAVREEHALHVPPGETVHRFFQPMPERFEYWSEFNPKLYALTARLEGNGFESVRRAVFGMREFRAEGRRFTINGQPVFLRGTLECCIFPETGHPAMTEAKWERIFSAVRAHGLNHMRFHSWCPPEAAFRVADRMGVYLQVELPNWSFKMGQLPKADEFFRLEGERMLREYGNHPSWVMFSMGNELLGDLGQLDGLVAHLKRIEPGLLFTSTSYSWTAEGAPRGLLPGPEDDYFVSMETKCGWVRGQGFLNATPPNTTSDYSDGVSCVGIPLVSHEAGQYNIFPDLSDLPRLNAGPLRAVAWEALRADLAKKGRLHEAGRYVRDSGLLAAVLYKEEMERALRTRGQSGIQLLDLHDFPGQSTATVGLLNAFWKGKGLISADEFRRFGGPTVPLARMVKRTFENSEMFEAQIEMAHYGPAPLTNAVARWRLREGRRTIAEGAFSPLNVPLGSGFQLGAIRQPLSKVTRPSKLVLSVEIERTGIANDWAIWVYPEREPAAERIPTFDRIDEPLLALLRAGGAAVLLPAREAVQAPIEAQFVPMFWSPMANPDKPGTLGATIDTRHRVWKGFPTGSHTDWQWWELLNRSFAIDLDSVSEKPSMPFRFVDKFNRNALPAGIFEVRVGAGRLLVCTLDISTGLDRRIVARQLRRSILSYVASREFEPRVEWSEEMLKRIAATGDPRPDPGKTAGVHAGQP